MVVMTRNLVDLGEGKQYKYNAQYTSRVARKIIWHFEHGIKLY